MKNLKRIGVPFAMIATAVFLLSSLAPAVQAYVPPEGITGRVTDYGTGAGMAGKMVTLLDSFGGWSTTTDANGYYYFYTGVGGSYQVQCVADTYNTQVLTVSISPLTGIGVANFVMVHSKGAQGFVRDEFGQPIADARVMLNDNLYVAITSSNGYYWLNPFMPVNYLIKAEKVGYWSARWDSVYVGTPVVSKDMTCWHDQLGAVPLGAIFASVDSTHTKVTLQFTKGVATKTVFSWTAGGSSYTKTSTWSLTQTYTQPNVPCMIIRQQAWMTGIYSHTTNKIVDSWARTMVNYYPWDCTTTDYWDKYDIDVLVPTMSAKKGWIQPVPFGGIYAPAVDVTKSVTWQLGVSLSVGAYGVSVPFECTSSATDRVKNSFLVTVENIDPEKLTHEYKYYLEGTDRYGGFIYHVWEM